MAKIILDIKSSVEENASVYFEKAKKLKKKLKGAEEALEDAKKKLKKIEAAETGAEKERNEKAEKERAVESRKKKWYEKFRWFISSEGFLCVGGRDATTNEIIIKKHTDKNDIVFHTKMAGSPFFVVKAGEDNKNKSDVNKPGNATLEEAAIATLTFSRAWKLNILTAEVFYISPEQVSKKANPGEYLEKGSFMIRGKMNIKNPGINLAVGVMKDGMIMAGPLTAAKKNCVKFVEIKQGKEKAGQIAKKIKKIIGGEPDDIIRVLPSGGFDIKK